VDLGVGARERIGVVIGIVVVRPLHVETEVHDGAERPAHVLRVERVRAAFTRFACERERFLSEALARRREELPLVVEALDRIGERRRPWPIASPAVRPVVITRDPHQRSLERVEACNGGCVEAVAARTIASGFEIAVERRERDVRAIDVLKQIWIVGLALRVVGHVAEEPNPVRLRAAVLSGRL